jgi:hypothetical protein
MGRKAVLAAGIFLGFTTLAAPATIHVDAANPNCPGSGTELDPFCAIQDAIDFAVDGDDVLVAPGIYVEDVDFLGKSIALASHEGSAATELRPATNQSTVRIVDAIHGAVVRGFTIRPGAGTPWPGGPSGEVMGCGGAILASGSALEIEGCLIGPEHGVCAFAHFGGGVYAEGGTLVFRGNRVLGDLTAHEGAGICLRGVANPELLENEFDVANAVRGGGAYLSGCSNPRLESNDFHDCGEAFLGVYGNVGTGAYLRDCPGQATIRDNEFRHNGCNDSGAAFYLENTSAAIEHCTFVENGVQFGGGAVAVVSSPTVVVRRCRFEGNVAIEGGAIRVYQATSATLVEDCVFTANHAFSGDAINSQGPLVIRRSSFVAHTPPFATLGICVTGWPGSVVEDCLFARNHRGWYGPGTLRRSTITANSLAGIVPWSGGSVTVESCIVAGNGGNEIEAGFGGTALVSDSLVLGGFPGSNVMDAEPLFVDPATGDYRLQGGSPCIDAGSPADATCDLDLDLAPRRVSHAFQPSARVDMGAYEFRHVTLAATETAPLGWQLDTSGTPGLATLLLVGLPGASTCLSGAGTLLLDPGKPIVVVPWVPAPSTIPVTLASPAGLPPQIRLQALALGPAGGANLSNPATLELQ